ncbi:hypothetical protein HDV05_007438 [Chytridiales sp. JEL 0842]|nr:hypothetical protein HDV05_007438 [Chytridiales sp. JEL 0842]
MEIGEIVCAGDSEALKVDGSFGGEEADLTTVSSCTTLFGEDGCSESDVEELGCEGGVEDHGDVLEEDWEKVVEVVEAVEVGKKGEGEVKKGMEVVKAVEAGKKVEETMVDVGKKVEVEVKKEMEVAKAVEVGRNVEEELMKGMEVLKAVEEEKKVEVKAIDVEKQIEATVEFKEGKELEDEIAALMRELGLGYARKGKGQGFRLAGF